MGNKIIYENIKKSILSSFFIKHSQQYDWISQKYIFGS